MGRLISMVEPGRFDPTPLITHHFALERTSRRPTRLFNNRIDGVLKVAVAP